MFHTMIIHKKVVVDDAGSPQEVIIPWAEFQEIEELLGLDLEPEVAEQLADAKRDPRVNALWRQQEGES